MPDLRQSPQYGRFTQGLGWQVARLGNCQVFIRRLPLIGSIIKIQRPESLPLANIARLAKKYRALFVKIEPKIGDEVDLLKAGYRRDSWPLLPTKTIWLDLTKSVKQLKKEISKETRYCLKKAVQGGTEISAKVDLEKFYLSFRRFGRGYVPRKKDFQLLVKSFGKKAILLSDNRLAGALILINSQTAYYYYAFTSPLGRKKLTQYLLVWQAIRRAKSLGCQRFDFEGVEDSRYRFTRRWRGFSHFKKSFGGQEVIFPGSFIKLLPGFAK